MAVAAEVTGLDVFVFLKVAGVDLADGFPADFVDKTAEPDIDEAEQAVLAIAAGDWDRAATAAWLRRHLRPHE